MIASMANVPAMGNVLNKNFFMVLIGLLLTLRDGLVVKTLIYVCGIGVQVAQLVVYGADVLA